jgi:ribonucleoside-diphosphate reductase alpha chain
MRLGYPEAGDVTVKARDLFRRIAQAAWECGDPGLQFHDNVNKWNTLKNDGEIVATNPCGELTALNNTSCNLASLNLVKFYDFKNMKFNIEAVLRVLKILHRHLLWTTKRPTNVFTLSIWL